ncbi:SAM-dependent methyltransferase [Streptomyces sp. DSM 42041]|uniref:SAM-dependent methyltransferase n=1 Tax=Streptomyces hazeniae TaxID=3075538 RepID=A0ABU2NYQ9_9ACTN|nr:SAM-dependent methyltransferase [Streptomyces sp. DSM 42041]MDT0382121.1 SAM-dependent methyltransferase [Streptomyces sp. DSM 42041]
MTASRSGNTPPRDLGLDRPHSARMYDYYLNGKTNYEVDRIGAEEALQAWPAARSAARANRSFMHRAVHVLTGAGFTQFLDIGTGIPTSPNLHEVAQGVHSEARVVYADNDPIVLTHARALLASSADGRTAYVEGDITQPDGILGAPELARTLDLTRPVALSMNAVLHFVPDDRDPYGIVARLLAALPSGSALFLSHVTADIDPGGVGRLVDVYNARGVPTQARGREEVARFFDGLDLLEPGITLAHRWRPDVSVPLPAHALLPKPRKAPGDDEVSLWAGVALKP